jgi:hypothetical protein
VAFTGTVTVTVDERTVNLPQSEANSLFDAAGGMTFERQLISTTLHRSLSSVIEEGHPAEVDFFVVEVESGKRNDRVALAGALKLCLQQKATLVIAKLDRLARNSRG